MWWEDGVLVKFFSRDTEVEFGAAARAAKKEREAAKQAKTPEEKVNPIKFGVKKTINQKGLKGQGYKVKGRVDSFR